MRIKTQEVCMQKVSISQLKDFVDQEVILTGWLYQLRSSGPISFLVLRDGDIQTCQCVFSKKQVSEEVFSNISKLTLESCVEVKGRVKKWKDTYEIEAQDLKLLSLSEPYPIGNKSHGVDFLLKNRHLWLRSKKQVAIMRIRNELIHNIHTYLQKEGFLQIDAPLITPNACEGTSSLFSLDFFGDPEVYLSQSGQLYMEAAAAAYRKVYSYGPTFRAEKSSTRRHLLEFWMVEPEIAFYDQKQAMELAENLLEYVILNTLKNKEPEFKVLERDTSMLSQVRAPFPRQSYKQACDYLKKKDSNFTPGKDLGGSDETLISSQFKQPCFVYDYPCKVKAFYMKKSPEEPEVSKSFDLLATEGYGELIGGGQREDSLQELEAGLSLHNLQAKDFDWYLDLRRYGSFVHSGFGLGIERLVAWVCGLDHVRETIPFPRLYGRSFFEKGNS